MGFEVFRRQPCSEDARRFLERLIRTAGRQTAVTEVYRRSRDLFQAQRFARHVSTLTTTVYTHPSDQEMWESVRTLRC